MTGAFFWLQVVCCEGNAGFYEYGIATTPIEAGFSVLGWNHPGFAGSTVSDFLSFTWLKWHSGCLAVKHMLFVCGLLVHQLNPA